MLYSKITDLKLIDKLIVRLWWIIGQNISWEEFIISDSAIKMAVDRLKEGYTNGELDEDGISLFFVEKFKKN